MADTTSSGTITLADAVKPSTSTSSKKSLNSLSSDDFLTLMMNELKNQDPSSPLSTADMVNQMSQMSMISTFEKLNTSFTSLLNLNWITLSTSMLGKTITYTNSDKETLSGTVKSVEYSNSNVYLNVNNTQISLNDVTSVSDGSTSNG